MLTIDTATVINVFITMAVGGIITFIVSRSYYVRAGKELRQESGELRRMVRLVLLGLEKAKLVEFGYDSDGNITGIAITATVAAGYSVARAEPIQDQDAGDQHDE